ncbi:MAG: polysaccharide deacetylase family protein, partial [Burkholderiaceae bacterium]
MAVDASRFSVDDRVSRPFEAGPLHWVLGATHVAGLGVIAAQPMLWPWAVGVMLGSHAVTLGFGLAPATTALGPVISRLPAAAEQRREVALTFDDGPDPEVTPRVLDLLDEVGAGATFFCVGARARAHPYVVREIAARGHSVENHAFAHSQVFGFFGIGALV